VFGFVNEVREAFPTVSAAPDQLRITLGGKWLARSIRFKALDDFLYLGRMRGDHGIVLCLGEVLGVPVSATVSSSTTMDSKQSGRTDSLRQQIPGKLTFLRMLWYHARLFG